MKNENDETLSASENRRRIWTSDIPRLGCFACAPVTENTSGLHLAFEKTESGARTQFDVARHFQSYPGFVHGGILTTILDETMAYAGLLHLARLPFTKNIAVEFIKALAADGVSSCEGSLVSSSKASFEAEGIVFDARGDICAKGSGRFFLPSYSRALKLMPGVDLSPWRTFLEGGRETS